MPRVTGEQCTQGADQEYDTTKAAVGVMQAATQKAEERRTVQKARPYVGALEIDICQFVQQRWLGKVIWDVGWRTTKAGLIGKLVDVNELSVSTGTHGTYNMHIPEERTPMGKSRRFRHIAKCPR